MKKSRDKVYEWIGFILLMGCLIVAYFTIHHEIHNNPDPIEKKQTIEAPTFEGKIGDCQIDSIEYDNMSDLDLKFKWGND